MAHLTDLFTLLLDKLWNPVLPFLVILTVVVFVHELGHFLVARWNGVRVEVFSIGFGHELFGWTAKSGTRWRVSWLPLGGYIKMFGDEDATSSTASETTHTMTPEERAVAFPCKRLGQRAAIVAAGPIANFIFGILALAAMFMILGQPMTAPVVDSVQPGSAAEEAGFKAGDRVVSIGGSHIARFQDIQQIVRLNVGDTLSVVVERDGHPMTITVTPRVTETESLFGEVHRIPVLGIRAGAGSTEVIHHGPISALTAAVAETANIVGSTFTAIGQMIEGTRSAEELGGPLRIAQGAGQAAQLGIASLISYTILLSINLGLINLFPIPMLDGGHLAFYAIEGARGRPLGARAQEYSFRVGLFLVFALMIFATRNDLAGFKVWESFKRLIS